MDKKIIKSFLKLIDYELIETKEDLLKIKTNLDSGIDINIENDFFKKGGELNSISYRKNNEHESVKIEYLKNKDLNSTIHSKHNYLTNQRNNEIKTNLLSLINYDNENILTNSDTLIDYLIGYYKGNNYKDLLANIISDNNIIILRVMMQDDIYRIRYYNNKEHINKELTKEEAFKYMKGILFYFKELIHHYNDMIHLLNTDTDIFNEIEEEFYKLFDNNEKDEYINDLLDNNRKLKLKK